MCEWRAQPSKGAKQTKRRGRCKAGALHGEPEAEVGGQNVVVVRVQPQEGARIVQAQNGDPMEKPQEPDVDEDNGEGPGEGEEEDVEESGEDEDEEQEGYDSEEDAEGSLMVEEDPEDERDAHNEQGGAADRGAETRAKLTQQAWGSSAASRTRSKAAKQTPATSGSLKKRARLPALGAVSEQPNLQKEREEVNPRPSKKRKPGRPRRSAATGTEDVPAIPVESTPEPIPAEAKDLYQLCLDLGAKVFDIDWLGMDEIWKEVAKATNELSEKVHKKSIAVSTRRGRNACCEIVSAMEVHDGHPDEYEKLLSALESRVKKFAENLQPRRDMNQSKATQLPEDSGVLQDIYAHLIPRSVYLILVVAAISSERYHDSDDTEALEAVIRVMSMTLSLCQTARGARAKLQNGQGIIGFTAKTVYSRVQRIRQAFFDELQSRRRAENLAHAETEAVMRAQASEDERVEVMEAIERDIEARAQNRKAWAHRKVGSIRGRQVFAEPPARKARETSRWTEERDEELIVCLSCTSHLPSKETFEEDFPSYIAAWLICL